MTLVNYAFGVSPPEDLVRTKNSYGDNGRSNFSNMLNSDIIRIERTKSHKYEEMSLDYWWVVPGSETYFLGSDLNYSSPTSSDYLALLGKTTDQVRGHSWNALVFMGELPESCVTILNTSRAILTSVGQLARGDVGGAVRSLGRIPGQSEKRALKKSLNAGDISGAWLSLRYGWEPLIGDCFEAAKAFEARTQNREVVLHDRKQIRIQRESSKDPRYSVPALDEIHLSSRTKIKEELSAARALGLLNPASLVWEKIPFSFVIDWFVPIGSYLDSLGIWAGTTATRSVTTFMRSTQTYAGGPVWLNTIPGARSQYVGGSYSAKRIVVLRTAEGPVVVPPPSLKALNKAFSLGHIQNASALVHQLISGSKASVSRYARQGS